MISTGLRNCFKWIGLCSLMLFFFTCKKEDISGVPYVVVRFQSQLTDPQLSNLNNTPGVATVDNYGVKGLVIVHEVDGSFSAYDRCSTVNPAKLCQIQIDGFIGNDPCSGAKFSLLGGGQPAKAPATVALRRYSVSVFGNSILVQN